MSVVPEISTGQPTPGISVKLTGFIVLSIVVHGLLLLIKEHEVQQPNPATIGNRVLSISLSTHKQEYSVKTADNKTINKTINTSAVSKNQVSHQSGSAKTTLLSNNYIHSENKTQPNKPIPGVMPPERVNTANAGNKSFDTDQKMQQRNYLLGEINHRLSQFLDYPDHARRRGWQGSVMIGFAVDKQGFLRDIHLTRTSGYNMLDSAALTAIKKVNSIPVNQWGSRFQPVVLQLPIIYQLTNS